LKRELETLSTGIDGFIEFKKFKIEAIKGEELKTIAVVGLGYVGLPLAVAFSEKYPVVGFDISSSRVKELKEGFDRTLEVEDKELKEALNRGIEFTDTLDGIKDANIYIVTVPTPIDKHKNPNLKPLQSASQSLGTILKNGDIVIYESTVYPGCTEEVCVPILESVSKLIYQISLLDTLLRRINPWRYGAYCYRNFPVLSGSTPRRIWQEIGEFIGPFLKRGPLFWVPFF